MFEFRAIPRDYGKRTLCCAQPLEIIIDRPMGFPINNIISLCAQQLLQAPSASRIEEPYM